MAAKERIGIYPGTFDPITYGHLDIIKRALTVVDRLVVGVAKDTAKTPIFSIEERVQLAQKDIQDLIGDASAIDVVPFEGLLVGFADEHKASVIIRGLRAVSDFEYEFQMSGMNSRLNPQVQTIFLPASETTHFISSRFVKEIGRLGGDITEFVSPAVKTRLLQYYGDNATL